MTNTKLLVDTNSEYWIKTLPNMQGNIVKHHGRHHAYHIFIQFDTTKKTAIKKWISSLPITDSYTQLKDTERYKQLTAIDKKTTDEQQQLNNLKTKVVQFFFLSNSGYKALELNNSKLTDVAFTAGMQKRKQILNDTDVKDWDLLSGTKGTIDALLIIASNNVLSLTMQIAALNTAIKAKGIKILHTQKGEILKNENGLGIEHFGYVDGISQPIFIKEENEIIEIGKEWNDLADIKQMALVQDVEGDVNAFGSYFVFRKLEQNVKAFKEAEKNLNLGEVGGAYIVGRFESGTPVVKFGEETVIKNESELDNDFNYKLKDSATKCPFHAHIRMTNPRDLQPEKPIRIVRRGIPYDDAGRANNLDWQPTNNVGLLFMCYAKSIVGQFEVIQGNWANNGTIFNTTVGIDGVIGQGNNTVPQQYPLNWADEKTIQYSKSFADFVTLQGGEYFFAPSITYLKSI